MDVKRRATFSPSPFPRHPGPGQSLRSRTRTAPIERCLCGHLSQRLGLRSTTHQGLSRPDVGESHPVRKGWPGECQDSSRGDAGHGPTRRVGWPFPGHWRQEERGGSVSVVVQRPVPETKLGPLASGSPLEGVAMNRAGRWRRTLALGLRDQGHQPAILAQILQLHRTSSEREREDRTSSTSISPAPSSEEFRGLRPQ